MEETTNKTVDMAASASSVDATAAADAGKAVVAQNDGQSNSTNGTTTTGEPVAQAAAPAAADKSADKGGGGDVTLKKEGLLGEGQEQSPAAKEEPGTEKDKEKEESAAPAEYQPFKLAEGMKVDDEVMTEFKAFAKESGMSQEKAQRLIDMQNKIMAKSSQAAMKQIDEQTDALITKWENDVRADKELGGAKLADNMRIARSTFKALGVPEAEQVIMESRLGSNPAILKLLFRAGQALGEAKFINGSPSGADEKSAAATIYPEMK